MSNFVEPSSIRSELVQKILAAFEQSMPIYKDMMDVARDINAKAGEQEAQRLGRIMHAAIRCASDDELHIISDLFSLMGCHPVNYYDLRERVSVESTAFRPVTQKEIELNGFRVFCSKLALDCIPVADQQFVKEIIGRRRIFDGEFLNLIEVGKSQGGFNEHQASEFVDAATRVFTRPKHAMVSYSEYERLGTINKVAAQVLVCNSLAFNHLTPSVASVPAAHDELTRRGIKTIPVWQGPVDKDVILRQTSCLAPGIKLSFPEGNGTFVEADYQETFVEFEERLQALTPIGRELFESLFDRGKQALRLSEADPGYAQHYYDVMSDALSEFPGDPQQLWKENLAYFTFELSSDSEATATGLVASKSLDAMIESGQVRLVPQQYEDFFGPAATNIFNSNIGLDDVSNVGVSKPDSQSSYERALGRPVINMYDYYDSIQAESKRDLVEIGT